MPDLPRSSVDGPRLPSSAATAAAIGFEDALASTARVFPGRI